MKKLIAYTLYGEDPKYVEGMVKNVKSKDDFYPDWQIIVYHDDSLQNSIIDFLKSNDVILRDFTDSGMFAASWRFCAFDEPDTERIIVRDSDSRFTNREAEAVKDWEDSGKHLHVMRDHPHHGYSIMGGMWGIKCGLGFSMKEVIMAYQGGRQNNITDRNTWLQTDQKFLRDGIYKAFGHPDTCKVHAAMDYMDRVGWQNENWAEDFPSPIDEEKHFIGEIFVFDKEGNEQREYQYKER